MKIIIYSLILVTCYSLFFKLNAQAGDYYNLIDTNSPAFVNELQSRVRIPYTKVSYDQFDETNITNFAAFNSSDGIHTVYGVYTHFEYIYAGTFTWIPLSREHTYCHSWMPTHPSKSGDEYSDQHHLFPVHQHYANGVRSNHPLGNVTNITSSFLDGKYGTDSNGNNVYEPRDEHKGDAARALFYMVLRYDGIDGNDWDFNWLNNSKLPSLTHQEGPQDITTLIDWHKLDPPDKWEVDRNNYIQSIQDNRNPFIDHPEYVNYIDFGDLSKLSPTYLNEPEHHLTNLSELSSINSITVSWTDAAGSQLPNGYLLEIHSSDNYFIPIDGEVYNDDLDLSDNSGYVNIQYSDLDSYTFTSLISNSTYYITIYPYSGSGNNRNYKTDGDIPSISTTTISGPQTLSAGDIVIVGFNMDNPDEFAFIPLVELSPGTEIKFTDNGWLAAGGFRSSVDKVTYTAPSSIDPGTIIHYNANQTDFSKTGSFLLSTSGDQIIVYTGDESSPAFLYAINSEGAGIWQDDATNSNTSALPSGLTNGITAVALDEIDNAVYTGPLDIDSSDFLTLVSNKGNWSGSNSSRQTMP
jgi:endonuclease I